MHEAFQGVDPHESAESYRDIHSINIRNLFNMSTDDVGLIPDLLDLEFVRYCEGITSGKVVQLPEDDMSKNGSDDFLETLRTLCRGQSYSFRPYIQTSRAFALAQTLGVAWEGAAEQLINQGIIYNANSKVAIKSLATAAGIKVAPYAVASNLDQLMDSIEQFGLKYHQLFVKKDGMCGGRGNISGICDELKKVIPTWYRAGNVLVEPMLPVRVSLGSLFDIQSNQIDFLGIDEQFYDGYKWSGFQYPYCNEAIADKIRVLTLHFAEQLRSLGLCGPGNFDWLVMDTDYPEAELYEGDVVLSECNFRYTGVYPSLNIARQCIDSEFQKAAILSYARYPLDKQYSSFTSLFNKLSNIRYDKKPILIQSGMNTEFGVLISRPPANGTCGITFFGRSQSELAEYANLLASSLG